MVPVSSDVKDPVLWQMTGICRRYGRKTVLDDITFSGEKGEVLGLLGPNGSGKTTLLEIAALAARPTSGIIWLNGADILAKPGPARSEIGYVPQDIELFEEQTVMDNLLCWSRLPREQSRARIDEISEALSLKSIAGMVTLFPVDSVDDGLAMLKNNEVSVLLHIPPGVIESLSSQGTVQISICGTPGHALEMPLIAMTLGHSLLTVSQGQNQMIAAKELLVEKGVPPAKPTFSAAIFALFAAFSMLPLIHFTASDLPGSILRRGLACGRGIFQFYFSRLASVCFSALAAALAAWIGKVQPALWIGFYLAMGMAVAGGPVSRRRRQ